MRLKNEPDLPAGNSTEQLRTRIATATRRWKRGRVERILNALSFIAALATALAFLAVSAFGQEAGQSPGAQAAGVDAGFADSCRAPAIPADTPPVVLVSVGGPEAVKPRILGEMIESYLRMPVVSRAMADFDAALLADARLLVFYGEDEFQEAAQASKVIEAALAAGLPIAWIGPGIYAAQAALNIELDTNGVAFHTAPEGAELFYNGTPVWATDVLMAEAITGSPEAPMEVLAWYRGPEGESRPAISARAGFLHIGFDPLNGLDENYAMTIAMDALADRLKDRERDPRVIMRLEDLNPFNYGGEDTTLTEVSEYLLDRGVFLHLAVIPEFANAEGEVTGNIGDVPSLPRLLETYPDRIELVQHGHQHYRDDLRNAGLVSGAAFEFFYDDDETLGAEAVTKMVRERLTAGRALVEKYLGPVRIFEAPHWEMSPAGEAVVEDMFTMVHHPPLNQGGWPYYVVTPWFTLREGTSYAPSSAGYVSLEDPYSVDTMLEYLRTMAALIDDPVVVIFYHPFVWSYPKRRADLAILVDGIEALGYRFVSTCGEVSRLR